MSFVPNRPYIYMYVKLIKKKLKIASMVTEAKGRKTRTFEKQKKNSSSSQKLNEVKATDTSKVLQ